MSKPVVTVVTPSYNQGHFIRATIESVLSQDYPHIEYIVIDGGSTDQTLDVVKKYQDRLQFYSAPDGGTADAINKGFRRARGSIWTYLNADDTYLPGAVSTAVRSLLQNPDVVGVYGDAFHDIPRLPFYAQNGGKNRLFRNVGGKHFVDVTDAAGVGDTGWSVAVAAADFDNDGYPELVVANDFGKKTLYHNNRDGTFTEVTQQAGVLDFSGGMGIAVGDFDDDNLLDLYFSNINSNQRWFGEDMTVSQYVRNVARTKWLLLDAGEYKKFYDLVGSGWPKIGTMIGKGNTLFRNNRDGTFTEVKDSHTTRAGWGWGVAFFDMDNDTNLDIYAANGWISGKNKDDL